jgi:hypothetical protein
MRLWHSLIVVASLCVVAPSFGADDGLSGTYSNLHSDADGGGVWGVEILILPASGDSGGYVALIQIAEGSGPYSVLVSLKVNGLSVQFDLPKDGPYPGIHFSGIVSKNELSGTWNTGRKEVLKRGVSYWNRSGL